MKFRKLASLIIFLTTYHSHIAISQEVDITKSIEEAVDALAIGGGIDGEPTEDIQSNIISVLKPELTFNYDSSLPTGDNFNPSTGSITFATTDITIPGNSNIPVSLKRWIPAGDMDTGGPSDWKWDIPFIVGNYLDVKQGHSDVGWDWGSNSWHNGYNCDGSAVSAYSPKDEKIVPNTFWSGKKLHIPGETSDVFLTSSSGVQITKSNYKISECINNANAEQGIKVKSPNGLIYTFNKVKNYYNGKTALKNPVVWTKMIMVTKIEDRFGNYVNYHYQGDELTSISSSDGRNITITYQSITVNGVVKKRPVTATANGRVWHYSYIGSGLGTLDSVELPDGKTWSYNNLKVLAFKPDGLGNIVSTVKSNAPQKVPGCGVSTTIYNASVTTPYGLNVSYEFKPIIISRSDIDPSLFHDSYADVSYARNMHCNIDIAMTKRTIVGAGVPSFNWDYTYSENTGNYNLAWLNSLLSGTFTLSSPIGGFPSIIGSTSNSQHFRTTTVENNDEKTIYYIDRKFQSNTEGMVVAVDYIESSSNKLLKREEKSYAKGAYVGSNWFLCPCGGDNSPSNSVNLNQTSYKINLSSTTTKSYVNSSFDTYTTAYTGYDTYGFPSTTAESNNFNGKNRYLKNTYYHDTTNWLIGLPATQSLSTNGSSYKEVYKTTYHSATGSYKSLPNYQYVYGRWYKRNASYHTSGTQGGLPNQVIYNGTNRWVYYSNYKRGIAQTIRTPQSLSTSSQYAYNVVDNNGWQTKQTDFLGQCVNYGYDSMGRMTLVDPCDSPWLSTSIGYVTTSGSDGLSYVTSGMLKQTMTKGNQQTITYHDSLLRPILSKAWDKSIASTAHYTRNQYDAFNRPTYQSLPYANSTTPYGILTTYDGLGRPKVVDNNTTSGTVSYSYLSNNRVQMNDNKGNVTTTTYLAYGAPELSMATTIASPESVATTSVYNIYGNLTSISQGGQTEYRAYDSYQQLCKVNRQDVGRTAYQHDALGQLSWQATDNSVSTSNTACDTSVSATDKATFAYDNLGNIRTINFGDSSPDKSYVYDKNSRVTTLTAGNVNTTYLYNSQSLLEKETLSVDGQSFILDYVYNSTGNLTNTIYPSGANISYVPNALGQAKQAGSYASNTTYHANGMVKSHSYGNGFAHTSTQKTSGLPNTFYDKRSSTYALHHGFTYDANNNVTFLDDKVNNAYDLKLTFDGLDRLNTITDSYLGTGDVNYDTMGNISYYKLGSQTINYVYNSSKQLDYTTGSKSYSFTYDDKGNVTDNGTRTFAYNTANQMVDSDGYLYTYDGNNKRVKEHGSNGLSYSFYASNGKLMYRKANNQHIDYYYLGGKLVANKKGSAVTYLHSDYLGSTAAESNTSGTVTSRLHYQPFGESIEAPKDDIGYTGHKFDTDLGLSYMQARYYDPVIGRFYSNDPIGFRDIHSFNRYAYANNNPYKYVDPDGMAPNKAGVTTIAALKAEIRGYEKSGMKGAAIMGALSKNHGSNSNRYLATAKHGFVDLRHFGKAAEMASSVGSVVTETLGLGNEAAQWASEWGDDYRSGFSPEDISSNAAGAAFGDDYMNGSTSVSDSLDSWLSDAGAMDPTNPASGTSSLPATDPAVKGGANRGSSNISNSNNCPAGASNCS